MHLLTAPLLYRVLTFQTNPRCAKWTGIGLFALFTLIMVTHMVMDEFLLHAATFAVSVYVIATRMLKLITAQVPDAHIEDRFRKTAALGLASFGLGYLFWLVDSWTCWLLTDMRHAVGLPWAFLLELHGWWHVFTCIGGYIAVALVDMLTSGRVAEDPTASLAWPVSVVGRYIDEAGTGHVKQ
ncbi:hypothetical protein UVI_02044750 [Ustilaginoidea virens]|nr:hypothetical protein UVI_02044750 [Ustilaginoidea virens]